MQSEWPRWKTTQWVVFVQSEHTLVCVCGMNSLKTFHINRVVQHEILELSGGGQGSAKSVFKLNLKVRREAVGCCSLQFSLGLTFQVTFCSGSQRKVQKVRGSGLRRGVGFWPLPEFEMCQGFGFAPHCNDLITSMLSFIDYHPSPTWWHDEIPRWHWRRARDAFAETHCVLFVTRSFLKKMRPRLPPLFPIFAMKCKRGGKGLVEVVCERHPTSLESTQSEPRLWKTS